MATNWKSCPLRSPSSQLLKGKKREEERERREREKREEKEKRREESRVYLQNEGNCLSISVSSSHHLLSSLSLSFLFCFVLFLLYYIILYYILLLGSLLTETYRLDCENNRLRRLPMEMGGLGRLMWLILDNNQLTHIPHSIGGLTSLERYFGERERERRREGKKEHEKGTRR